MHEISLSHNCAILAYGGKQYHIGATTATCTVREHNTTYRQCHVLFHSQMHQGSYDFLILLVDDSSVQ